MPWQVQLALQLDETFLVNRTDRILEPQIVELVEQSTDGQGLETVVHLYRVMHQDKFVADRFANFADYFHVPDVCRDFRSGAVLAASGMNLIALVAELLGLECVRYVVLDGRQMIGTGIGHDAVSVIDPSLEDLIDRAVHCLAENV